MSFPHLNSQVHHHQLARQHLRKLYSLGTNLFPALASRACHLCVPSTLNYELDAHKYLLCRLKKKQPLLQEVPPAERKEQKRGRWEERSSDCKGGGGVGHSLWFAALLLTPAPLQPVGLVPSLVSTHLCQFQPPSLGRAVLRWVGSHSCSLRDKQASRHLKEPDEDKVAKEAGAHR